MTMRGSSPEVGVFSDGQSSSLVLSISSRSIFNCLRMSFKVTSWSFPHSGRIEAILGVSRDISMPSFSIFEVVTIRG